MLGGQSIKKSIHHGLRSSGSLICLVTEAWYKSKFTQWELEVFADCAEDRTIVPVYLTQHNVARLGPELAHRIHRQSTRGSLGAARSVGLLQGARRWRHGAFSRQPIRSSIIRLTARTHRHFNFISSAQHLRSGWPGTKAERVQAAPSVGVERFPDGFHRGRMHILLLESTVTPRFDE